MPSTIMVVEDEVLILCVVSDYLRGCGYDVVEAGSADEAVRILQADDTDVDIVFSDVQMPGSMDGMGLARWIREFDPSVKVVLASGNVQTAELATDLCHLGPIEQKPYSHDALLRRIENVLQSSGPDNA